MCRGRNLGENNGRVVTKRAVGSLSAPFLDCRGRGGKDLSEQGREALKIEEGKRILNEYKKRVILHEPMEESYDKWDKQTDTFFKELGDDEETKNWFQEFLPGSPNILDLIETRIFFLENVLVVLEQILGNLHQEPAYDDLFISNAQ